MWARAHAGRATRTVADVAGGGAGRAAARRADLAAEPVEPRRHDAGPRERRLRLLAPRRRGGYTLRAHLAAGKDWALSSSAP